MTREEAIKKLQKQKAEYLEEWVDYSGVAEAYDMAIKALEEYPEKIILRHNDKVIIEPTLYMKPQIFHDNVELILKQMESGDVTVLPTGFTAKIVRRDAVIFEDRKGETDDN